MKHCSNCGKSHGPLKRYYWNTRTKKGKISQSHEGLLCEQCAKSLGAWQIVGQGETITIKPGEEVIWIESIEEPITIGTPEEAERVAQSLTDEDIERLEREEKFASLN